LSIKKIFIILLFVISFLISPLFANKINFTQNEKLWLKNNPLTKIAIMSYWESDQQGNSIHTDLLKLLNKYGGIDIIPVRYDNWSDGFKEASKGDSIHGIMNLSWSKERERDNFYYSQPYDFKPYLLITKKENNTIHSLKDLKNEVIYIKQK